MSPIGCFFISFQGASLWMCTPVLWGHALQSLGGRYQPRTGENPLPMQAHFVVVDACLSVCINLLADCTRSMHACDSAQKNRPNPGFGLMKVHLVFACLQCFISSHGLQRRWFRAYGLRHHVFIFAAWLAQCAVAARQRCRMRVGQVAQHDAGGRCAVMPNGIG